MKVGDLVKCPETCRQTALQQGELNVRDKTPGYVGVIVGVYGHKVEVLGGSVVSWDGVESRYTWDKCDISLVNQ